MSMSLQAGPEAQARGVQSRRLTVERAKYEPDLPAPAVLAPVAIRDPSGDGWWDPTLTPEEVRVRIEGLARTIEAMPPSTPPEWMQAERQVLARLRLRAAVEERRREDEEAERMRAARRPAGKPKLLTPEQEVRIWELVSGGMTRTAAAEELGVSRRTASRALARIRQERAA